MKKVKLIAILLFLLLSNFQYLPGTFLNLEKQELNEEKTLPTQRIPKLASNSTFKQSTKDQQQLATEELNNFVAETLNGFTGGFLENNGQKNDETFYYTESSQMGVGFGLSEIRFSIINQDENHPKHIDDPFEVEEIGENLTYTTIALEFSNSNTVVPIAEEPTGTSSNYIIGSDKAQWVVSSQYYTKIIYYNIYDNIDLVYLLKDGQLKYEFFVHPGGIIDEIKLNWKGPVKLDQTNDGIKVIVENGNINNEFSFLDTSPINYQSEERDLPVEGSFEILGEKSYGFSIPKYDPARLLIIDPTLRYSTYVSGSNGDSGSAIAIDGSGNAYVTGETKSIDFPTVSAYDATGDGNTAYTDVFVFKLNSTGNGLVYSTYVGGNRRDYARAIAIDGSGNAYVTGFTDSTNFPTVNAYNATSDGSTSTQDVFVFKLNSAGNNLVYSTYVSGISNEQAHGIVIDGSGNAYVTGDTLSTNFPTVNAYNATGDGSASYKDVFVFKLNSTGNGLVYSTYVGGSVHDYGKEIAIDGSGNAYVTGSTNSADFPTVNAYNATGDGNTTYSDVFVFKLNSAGNSLVYSTYVSGSHHDLSYGIAIDGSGNAYVTGETRSIDFPTVNAYDDTGDGSTSYPDVFVFKLNSAGNDLVYSTYVSGSINDYSYGIAIDGSGNVYVTGSTYSTDFPTVSAYDDTGDGSTSYRDAFVFKLNSTGNSLLYSTYVSGSYHEYSYGIAIDGAGDVYATGQTTSTDFPTVNAYNATSDGSASYNDVFVFKLRIPKPIYITSDSDFVTLGFPGDGVQSNPYIIDGYHITNATTNLISIQDTTAYFRIQNCRLNGVTGSNYGIYLNNVINGNISNNNIVNCDRGIYLSGSDNNSIIENSVSFSSNYGLIVSTSDRNLIHNNTIWNSTGYGIDIASTSSDNNISWNAFINNNNQARDDGSTNQFTYNYWDDHTGSDTNVDGIIDTPYSFTGNQDPFPLMYSVEWYSLRENAWIVSSFESYQNLIIILSGSLIISSTGNLILKNVTLVMNCDYDGQYHIEVNSGGNLSITTNSILTTINTSNAWYLKANSGSYFLLDNSTISYAGWEFGSSGDHTGLWINTDNAQIFNCTIMNNYYGTYLYQVYNLNLSGTWIYNNSNYGVYVEWGGNLNFIKNTVFNNTEGFYLSNPSYASIHNNTIFKNEFGVRIFNTADNINITDNLFYNNSDYAIQVSDSSINNSISYNTIKYSGRHGIYISSDDNLVFNNIIYSVNQFLHHGIHLTGGGGNDIYNNTIYNIYHGIHVGSTPSQNNLSFNYISNSTIGVYFGSTDNCLIYNNTIRDSMYGIFFDPLGGISNNTIERNIIYGNSQYGIYLEGSTNNTISNNSISSNSNSGIHLVSWSNNNTIINNKIYNNAYGITLTSSAGFNFIYHNNIFDNSVNQAQDDNGTNIFYQDSCGNYWGSAYTGLDINADGFGDTPYIVPGTPGNIDPYPLLHPVEWYFSFNITVINGNWIVSSLETHQNKIITLNGNLLVQSGGNLTLSNIILRFNCSVEGEYGLEIFNGGNLTINANSVVTAVDITYSWHLKANSGSTIHFKESTLNYAGGMFTFRGLDIQTNDAVIESCIIHNIYEGIYLYLSNNSIIYNNTFYNNDPHGITLTSNCNHHNIINNTFYDTIAGNGIKLENSMYNNIINNTIYNNSYNGILFFGSFYNNISHNTIFGNGLGGTGDGIRLQSSSHHNNINDNAIYDNFNNGIALEESSNNSIFYNNLLSNSQYGIYLYSGSGYCDIYLNDIQNNAFGEASDNNGTNIFYYNGFGNYWGSAYTGSDNNNDGIGDSPYTFTGNQDLYPLMFSTVNLYFIEGDWIVTGDEYRQNVIIILSGNLTISSTGNLTLHNVLLRMNCNYDGQYHIEVENGGYLSIEAISTVTAVNPSYMWYLRANSGSTLQLKNSTFSYAGSEFGTWGEHSGIWINTDYSEIINCRFYNSLYGLVFHYADFSLVTDCVIRDINQRGINLMYSNNNSFSRNTINNTSLSYAVYMYSSSNNTFLANTVYEGYAEGIHMEWSSYNNFSHNIIMKSKGSQGHGISISSSDFNYLYNNTFFNNDKFGVVLSSAYNNTLLENRIYNNTGTSTYAIYMGNSENNSFIRNLIYDNEYGVYITGSNNNNISHNEIYGNNNPGMYLTGSSYNTISNNNIFDNREYGIRFQSSCHNNTIAHNKIYDNGYSGISFWGCENNSIFENYLTQNGWEGIALLESNNTIITYNRIIGSTWGVFISSDDNFNNLIERNAFIDNYQGVSQAFDDDPTKSNIFRYNYYNDWVTPDTNIDGIVESPYPIFGSAGNTDPYPLTYLYITHDPIDIDENSDFSALGFPGSGTKTDPYLIDGVNITSTTTSAITIKYTNAYFVVSNSLIIGVSGWEGIELRNTSHGILANNIIRSAVDGIYAYGSNDTLIQNNLAFNNTWYGISLYSSTNCTVRGNEIHDNGHYGIALYLSSTNITVSNNNLYNIYGSTDQGIVINGGIYHTVYNNTISNYTSGIAIVSSGRKNNLSENMITECSSGIYLTTSSNNTIINNHISNNSINGIYLVSSSNYNKISYNTIVNNTENGIMIITSSYNNIMNNDISFNVQRGVLLYISCFYNQIYNNTIYNNTLDGVVIQESTDNDIMNNDIFNNSQRGILIFKASNRTTISDNNIYNNNHSIFVHTSSYNTLERNIISNNIGSGIVLYNYSDFNVVLENTVNYSSQFGIILNGSCHNNTISWNTVYNNSLSGIGLGFSNNNTISSNIVYNNNVSGIGLNASSSFNTITKNTIFNTTLYGIWLNNSISNIVLNNSISDNNDYGIFIYPSVSGTLIKWNDFIDNNPTGVSQACDNGTVNVFQYNYWNDWTEPDNNLDGIVDVNYSIAGTATNFDEFPLAISAIHNLSSPTIVYPNGGESISDNLTIEWNDAADSLTHLVTYDLYYSSNGGTDWILIISGLTNSSYSWNTTTAFDGNNYLIRVNASCTANLWEFDDSDNVFTINNGISDPNPPIIIDFPNDLSYHELTTPDNLSWTATDQNPDTYSIWRNNSVVVSGYNWINNAPITVQIDDPPGVYNFTIEITDTNGNSVVDEVWVTVNPNLPPNVTVISPNGGEILQNQIFIAWTASDELDMDLTFSVYYWNGHSWVNLVHDITVTTYQWDTTSVVDRSDYMIRVNASDGFLMGGDDTDAPFAIDNVIGFERIPIGQTEFQVTDTITVAINVTAEVDITIELITEVTTPPPEEVDPFGIYLNITVSDTTAIEGLWINVSFSELGGADPANAEIYYFNEEDNRWYPVRETGVDFENEVVWGWASHLTLFGVMDVQVQAPDDFLSILILAFIIIVPTTVIAVFIYRRTKSQLRRKKVKKEVRKAQIDLGLLTKDFETD